MNYLEWLKTQNIPQVFADDLAREEWIELNLRPKYEEEKRKHPLIGYTIPSSGGVLRNDKGLIIGEAPLLLKTPEFSLLVGGRGLVNGAVDALVTAGNKVLTNPYVDAILSSFMLENARQDLAKGLFTPETALNLIPAIRLANPATATELAKLGISAGQAIKSGINGIRKVGTFLNSPLTGKWVLFGNREYRFKPNILGVNAVPIETRVSPKLNTHVQGAEAVKMFKEYGGEPIPEGSINGTQLRAYVPEVRERYGLTGNADITDEEIAQALYKHSKELAGNTAAVNAQGEPQLLFRGSTQRNTVLHPKGIGRQQMSGADNILGNLFLGELPGTVKGQGLERYLGLDYGFLGPTPPQTGAAKVIGSDVSYLLFNTERFGPVLKLSPKSMQYGANDINSFIVRTPSVRNATEEISVLRGLDAIPKAKRLGPDLPSHYRQLVRQSEVERQGLLKSEPAFEEIKADGPFARKEIIPKYRDEHEYNTYFALPNWNIRNAKHLLAYDLRIPRNWDDPNIYRIGIPVSFGLGAIADLQRNNIKEND